MNNVAFRLDANIFESLFSEWAIHKMYDSPNGCSFYVIAIELI